MSIVYDHSDLYQNRIITYRNANGSRPEVFVARLNDHKVVVKDYSPCPGLFGTLLGPLLVYREKKALKNLTTINGIPNCYECNNSRTLVMSYFHKTKLVSTLGRELDWQKFESRLTNLIAQIHNKGIVHCDLRSPGNILIDDKDTLCIVDFVASFSRSKWNPLWNFAFKQAVKADYSAILKIKTKARPDLLSKQEKLKLHHDANRGGLFRYVTGRIRLISQSLSREN